MPAFLAKTSRDLLQLRNRAKPLNYYYTFEWRSEARSHTQAANQPRFRVEVAVASAGCSCRFIVARCTLMDTGRKTATLVAPLLLLLVQ